MATTDAFDRLFGIGRRGSGAASSRFADLPIVRRECLGIAQAFALAANGHVDDVLQAARREKTGWKQGYLFKAVTLATAEEFFPWARRHLDFLLLDARARCDSDASTRAKLIVDDPALMGCLIGGVAQSLRGMWPYGVTSSDIGRGAMQPTLTACFVPLLKNGDLAYLLLTKDAQEQSRKQTQLQGIELRAWVARAVDERAIHHVVKGNAPLDQPSAATDADWEAFGQRIAVRIAELLADPVPF